MTLKVCLSANICHKNGSGGCAWLYLNWALGLRALGCQVIWLEEVEVDEDDPNIADNELQEYLALLKNRLKQQGLADCSIAFCSQTGEPLPWDASGWYLTLEDAAEEADLFLNVRYQTHPGVVGRFRRSALVDSDPGLMQLWMSCGQINMARHDLYFTISETVGTPMAQVPDCGVQWHYTPLPVFLPSWPPTKAEPSAPFTTVSNWWGDWIEFQGETLSNEKRKSFLDYLDLPSRTPANLELALTLGPWDVDVEERRLLELKGWKVRSVWGNSNFTPEEYRTYVQRSRGEFSCAKPFFVLLETTWLPDRTLHYLASGKPAIVQYTGPSSFLPDGEGLFRFRNLEEASRALSAVEADYDRQCQLAHALVKEYFDAPKVVGRVLERILA